MSNKRREKIKALKHRGARKLATKLYYDLSLTALRRLCSMGGDGYIDLSDCNKYGLSGYQWQTAVLAATYDKFLAMARNNKQCTAA